MVANWWAGCSVVGGVVFVVFVGSVGCSVVGGVVFVVVGWVISCCWVVVGFARSGVVSAHSGMAVTMSRDGIVRVLSNRFIG